MVRAVYACARATGRFRQALAFDSNGMHRFIQAGAAIVIFGVPHLARDVLYQGPVLMHIQQLRAVTDR